MQKQCRWNGLRECWNSMPRGKVAKGHSNVRLPVMTGSCGHVHLRAKLMWLATFCTIAVPSVNFLPYRGNHSCNANMHMLHSQHHQPVTGWEKNAQLTRLIDCMCIPLWNDSLVAGHAQGSPWFTKVSTHRKQTLKTLHLSVVVLPDSLWWVRYGWWSRTTYSFEMFL